MKTFIAFFDILGFKEIVRNNSFDELVRLFENFLLDAQKALSGDRYEVRNNIYPDLKNQKVNCLHISDSIIFWTKNDSDLDFKNLVEVSYSFYSKSLFSNFPIRGYLTYGEVDFRPFNINENTNGVIYYHYSMIGKGLVDAYLKCENIDFAGCVIDENAIKKVKNSEIITNLISEHKLSIYKVPLKNGASYEYVLRPVSNGSINDISFMNRVKSIIKLFTYASKQDIENMPKNVKNKLNNTLDFINYFRDKN